MEYTHIYHGIQVTKKEFEILKTKSDKDVCPFCEKRIAKKYNNMNKHLRTCIHKLKTEITYLTKEGTNFCD